MFPPTLAETPADLMVTVWDEESIAASLALARALRAAGLRVDVYPEADKLGKQFKYASARGVRFVAVLGEQERESGEVALKDMASGEQRTLAASEVVSVVREKAGAGREG